jgi:hypothetical protein
MSGFVRPSLVGPRLELAARFPSTIGKGLKIAVYVDVVITVDVLSYADDYITAIGTRTANIFVGSLVRCIG